MIVIEDKAQKEAKHTIKHLWFEKNGVYFERYPLPVGDYILGTDKVMDVISRKNTRGMEPKKMDFLGTFDVAVDTKYAITELVNDVCGKDHARFRDECVLAQNNGIKLYILVETNERMTCIRDLFKWHNPRLARYYKIKAAHERGNMLSVPLPKAPPTSGETLAKAILTMEKKYGVTFLFCTPQDSGRRIVELLTGEKADE